MREASSPAAWLVACLCAEWCGTCRDYRAAFDRAAGEFVARAVFQWVDIEDHAEVPASIDVDDFPTLLIARAGAPLFFGPVTPHAQTLSRLIQSAIDGDLPPLADPRLVGLVQRVRRFGAVH